jgi:signal transduction histidine kinase
VVSSPYPRLVSLMSGLRLRLIMLFMLVVMIAVGTVALIASQASTNGLQVYMQTDTEQHLISTLLTAYRQHQSLQKLQALSEQLARSAHQRIILFDHQKRVLADSDHTLIGQGLPVSMQHALLTSSSRGSTSSPSASPLLISTDESPQSLDPNFVHIVASPSRVTFLTSMNHALWLAVLIAGLTALLLALVFANTLLKPLHTLKAAAEQMAQGDLSQRVCIKEKSEIGALAHAFNTMAESLSRSEQARRHLVNDVAHELRNPLMNIRGYLELLVEGVLEPTPDTLSSLYEETSLLSRLVADLQEVSLAEAGQLHLALQPVELADVVSQAVQILRPQAEQKHLTLHIHLSPTLPCLEADPERVAQILRNLLRNAITHTPAEGEISITAHRSQSWVHISVQNTGPGIAPEHLPYLFERFYRADPSRARATGGSGLGLAIVKQMVQAHGGQITVTSQQGQGACFTLTLPVPARPMYRQGSVSSPKNHGEVKAAQNPDRLLASSSSIPHTTKLS